MKSKIAIIGMSASFSKSSSAKEFWENILNKVDGITQLPIEERWGEKALFLRNSNPSLFSTYCNSGGIITEELQFDPLAYGIVPKELPEIDVDQLMALELVKEALLDAGIPISSKNPTPISAGLIIGKILPIGVSTFNLLEIVKTLPQVVDILRNTIPNLDEAQVEQFKEAFIASKGGDFNTGKGFNSVGNLLASRVANRFNLTGTCYTLDAACASSIIAIQNSITELENGNSDLMIAGGINYPIAHVIWQIFSNMGALAKSNSIKPFHADADGTLLGEGGGFVVLKRLEDALRDGDRVYSVIEGVGSSSDGRSSSLMSPFSAGQIEACKIAWKNSDVEIDELGFIECHGTGTPVGDQTEIETIQTFFGNKIKDKMPIGSVKSMIGHTLSAAGIAGVIKTAQALYNGYIPPSLHADEPSSLLENTPFVVQKEAKKWPHEKRRVAAVNSFGFGGINGHLILSYTPNSYPEKTKQLSSFSEKKIDSIVLTGDSKEFLINALKHNNVKSIQGDFRLIILDPIDEKIKFACEIITKYDHWIGKKDIFYSSRSLFKKGIKTAFLFPGIGVFINEDYKRLIDELNLPIDLTILNKAISDEERKGSETVLSGYVNFKLLESMGIQANMMAGHSLGDWTSCIASGIIDSDSLNQILHNLSHTDSLFKNDDYTLYSVSKGTVLLEELLKDEEGIFITADNAPNNSIVCIRNDKEAFFKGVFLRNQILSYNLGFHLAIHHSSIESSYKEIQPIIDELTIHPPKIPVWNATKVAPYSDDPEKIKETIYQNMLSPVRFRETVEELHKQGVKAFVQLGIGGLSGFVKEILKEDKEVFTLDTTSVNRSTKEMIRDVMSTLFVEGKEVDLSLVGIYEQTTRKKLFSLKEKVKESVKSNLSIQLINSGLSQGEIFSEKDHKEPSFQQKADFYYHAYADVLEAWNNSTVEESSFYEPALNSVIHSETIKINHEIYPELYDHELFKHHDDIAIKFRSSVVPMTMMITLSCQMIRKLIPDKKVVSVENSIALKFLSVTEPLNVFVEVIYLEQNKYKVSLADNFSCIITTAYDFPEQPVVSEKWKIDEEKRVPFVCKATEFYDQYYMFHGPLYQGMIRELDQDHTGSLFQMKYPGGCGSVIDTAMQIGGTWLYSSFPEKNLVLPLRIGKLEFFTDLEDFENLSTLFTCRTFVLNNTELEYSYGFEVANQNHIVLKLDIFQGRKFESNDTISKIYSKSTGFEKICDEIEENIFIIKSDFINSKWTWNMVENTYLDNFDRTRSQSIKHIKSQQSFILGRLAARESVKNHLNKKYTTKALFPTQIFISYDADNSPIANCLDVIDKEFHLSISHKDKYGIAFFGGDHKVGVDMEKILHESFDFSGKLVFSKSELALIERFNQSNKSTIKTIIWTAKESFFKQFENKREIKFTALVVQKIEEEASSKYEQKWIGKINGKSFTSIQWDKEYIITWII